MPGLAGAVSHARSTISLAMRTHSQLQLLYRAAVPQSWIYMAGWVLPCPVRVGGRRFAAAVDIHSPDRGPIDWEMFSRQSKLGSTHTLVERC